MLVSDAVKEVLANQLAVNKSDLTDDSLLVEDLGADSLDTVELCMELEDRFYTTVDDNELPSDATVGDIINLVKTKVGPECSG